MLGTSLEARVTTQEKVVEERFSAMETTSRMQKSKKQSVDVAADMARVEYQGSDNS